MKQKYAETKRLIKNNFVSAFGGFVGCEQVDVFCRPSWMEFKNIFHKDMTQFALSDPSMTKVILFAYAGHGCSDANGTYATLDTADKKKFFPVER